MLENRTGAQKFILSQKSIQHKGRKLLAPTEDWVSTIECCNTTGQVLPPYVILKGDGVKSYRRLIPDKKTFMRYQEKGIVDEKNQLKWLTRVFILQTAVSRKTLSKRGISSDRYTRLLLLDGHSSPISFEFVLTCWENDIIPLCIPPCTSHLLHPLDVGVLPDFTKIYTGEMRNNLHPHQLRISREVFFLLWWRSREEAMYPENVIMGWRNSGTWPVSKGVVYKRAGFDLPEARDVLDPTELKAPTNKEEFYTLLDQMLSSPPETSTQLREFLMCCFYKKSRSIDLLQENLSNHYDVQVDIERDLPETDAEVTKRRAEDDPAARTASGERSLFKRQNMNSTPNPEPIQLSSQPIQPPNASLNAGPQPEWHSSRNSYGCIGSVLPHAGPSIYPTGPFSGTSQYPGNLWQYES